MSTILKRLLVALGVVISASACAIPMGHGVTLYTLGEPQMVIVNSNSVFPGDLLRDGFLFGTLTGGGTLRVPLTYSINSNVVLTFKAFELTPDGRKIYRGQTSQTFYMQPGTNNNQLWTVDWVQPPR